MLIFNDALPPANWLELITHGSSLALVAFALKEYRTHRDLKTRVNTLWAEYCETKEIPFTKVGED